MSVTNPLVAARSWVSRLNDADTTFQLAEVGAGGNCFFSVVAYALNEAPEDPPSRVSQRLNIPEDWVPAAYKASWVRYIVAVAMYTDRYFSAAERARYLRPLFAQLHDLRGMGDVNVHSSIHTRAEEQQYAMWLHNVPYKVHTVDCIYSDDDLQFLKSTHSLKTAKERDAEVAAGERGATDYSHSAYKETDYYVVNRPENKVFVAEKNDVRTAIQHTTYWADEMSIVVLERVMRVKFLLFSNRTIRCVDNPMDTVKFYILVHEIENIHFQALLANSLCRFTRAELPSKIARLCRKLCAENLPKDFPTD